LDILLAFIELMGILKSSSRIDLILGENPDAFEEVSRIFKENHAEIISVGMSSHKDRKKRIYYFRIEKRPLQPIIAALKEKGYTISAISE